jgi:hypothetical protein
VESRPEGRPERDQDEHPERDQDGHAHAQAFVTGGAYALLFVFGVAQGLIGCFQFSWSVGQVPLAALGFCALILATCLLGAAAMGSAAGALLPAIGWFVASLILTMPTAQGSVIVTNTAAGQWYLYGGAACAAAGVVISLVRRTRVPTTGRRLGGRRQGGRGPGSRGLGTMTNGQSARDARL